MIIVCALFVLLTTFLPPIPARGASVSGGYACPGDCDQNLVVRVDEVVRVINMILGTLPLGTCPVVADPPAIGDAIEAINSSLFGCPITYRLTQGSRIVYSPVTGSPEDESLSGTFDVRVCDSPPHNTVFLYDITHLDLQGGMRFDVTGETGYIDAGTLTELPIASMYSPLLINNEEIGARGEGPYDATTSPPTLNGLVLCGGAKGLGVTCEDIRTGRASGYILTIVAVPTTADWRLSPTAPFARPVGQDIQGGLS